MRVFGNETIYKVILFLVHYSIAGEKPRAEITISYLSWLDEYSMAEAPAPVDEFIVSNLLWHWTRVRTTRKLENEKMYDWFMGLWFLSQLTARVTILTGFLSDFLIARSVLCPVGRNLPARPAFLRYVEKGRECNEHRIGVSSWLLYGARQSVALRNLCSKRPILRPSNNEGQKTSMVQSTSSESLDHKSYLR